MQFLVFPILTALFEPTPFPEMITAVPEVEGLGDGEEDGLDDGIVVGELLGVGDGFADPLGLADGEAEGAIEGEGVGKFAAAVNELFKFSAVSEKSPKTDWLTIASDKNVKTEKRKNVFLIVVILAYARIQLTNTAV